MIKLSLNSLLETFQNLNLKNEAALIDFFIKCAGYDDEWKYQIEQLSKKNKKPFNDWFGGEDRIYYDFVPDDTVEADFLVSEELEKAGYEIIDYVNGYCQKDGRQFRIGKILIKLMEDEIKEAKKDFSGTEEELKNYLNTIRDEWKKIQNEFLHSKTRANMQYRNNLQVVFSQSPHDIAKMSYQRGWTSCMELGTGSHYEDVFCEVESGGFVAYLIQKSDQNIEHPLARIHIRRFSDGKGIELAKPEEGVYGNETAGFQEFVNKWVEEKNKESLTKGEQKLNAGKYKRKGGKYSDTYGDYLIIPPESKEDLIKWFNRIVPESEEVFWQFRDNYYDELNDLDYWADYGDDLPRDYNGEMVFGTEKEALDFQESILLLDPYEEWIENLTQDIDNEYGSDEEELNASSESRAQTLRDSRFLIRKKTKDYKEEMIAKAVLQLINKYLPDLGDKLGTAILDYTSKGGFPSAFRAFGEMFKAYPHLLTQEMYDRRSFDEQIITQKEMMKIDPKKADELYGYLKVYLKKRLAESVDDIKYAMVTNSRFLSITSVMANALEEMQVDNELYHIIIDMLFSKLPSEIGKYTDSLPKIKEILNQTYQSILLRAKAQNMSRANAMDFASRMLEKINFDAFERGRGLATPSVHDWLWFVKDLAGDAEVFIPEIQSIYNEAEEHWNSPQSDSNVKEEMHKRKNRALFVLDCIKNNRDFSTKYKWSH